MQGSTPHSDPTELRIALIGLGQMAGALAGGWIKTGQLAPEQILGYDPATAATERFQASIPGMQCCASNGAAVDAAQIVILAVKPNYIRAVAREIQPHLTDNHLVVSIAAGVTLSALSAVLQTERVIRVMPNTPCLVGAGALAYSIAQNVSPADRSQVEALLGAVGIVYQVTEPLLDAVTGLSGSGPAYVYMMIEALSDAGVRVGLARPMATALATQTVYGAARMVAETGEHPAVLKERVTSPGGTTIAAVEALEQHGLRAACMAAVATATERAVQMRSS